MKPITTRPNLKFLALASCLCGLAAFGSADTYAYEIDGNASFGEIDLSNGSTIIVGSTQTASSQSVQLAGLANYNNTLYGANFYGVAQLYTINASNGSVTALGSSGISDGFAGFGSTTSGLYGLGTDGELYSVNASTGVATDIGNIGFTQWGDTWNLSSDGSSLYFAYTSAGGDPELAQINTTTGLATPLGITTGTGTEYGALGFVDGQWYGGGFFAPEQVDTLNVTNNTATHVSDAADVSSFYGIAPLTSPLVTPEPAPVLALGAGAFCLLLRRRRKS